MHALLGEDAGLVPLQRLLIARTAYSPFFLEESIRTLLETGALVGAAGAYRLTQAVPTIQVRPRAGSVGGTHRPPTPPRTKRLLQRGGIGTEVPLPLL